MAGEVIWEERKRNFLGLAWTFTKYIVYEERMIIKTGLLTSTEDEIRLYRVTDITLRRSLWQRMLGLGTIRLNSSDTSMPVLDIRNIRNSRDVRDTLSDLVDAARAKKNIYVTEGSNTGAGAPPPPPPPQPRR